MINEEKSSTKMKFTQPSESTAANTIIVHISKLESFICSLNPAASLYEDVTDEDEIRKCFIQLKEYLKTQNIKLITIEEALLLEKCHDDLLELAKESLNYERETKVDEINIEDVKKKRRKSSFEEYCLYSSEEYKEKILKKFSKKHLINIILTRPSIKLKHIETDTFIESTSINFTPLGNLIFCRDQQITTKKGVVMGRTRTNQRKYEHKIMKQVFKNLNVEIIGEVKDGYLEGGDYFVARENLSMLGIGLRTNINAGNYLMENDLLGTRFMALIYDENDKDQQRMHLDTYFNILNDDNAVVIDFEEVGKYEHKKIDRKVYYYDNDKSAKEIISDNDEIKNKVGEYKLIKIY